MWDGRLKDLLKNNSFSLTAFRDQAETDKYSEVTCDCCNFYIQFGNLYGIYYLENWGETMSCYFFCIDEYDSVLNDYMFIKIMNDREIGAMLPSSDTFGLFRRNEDVYGFTDEYIIDLLVWTYNSESETLKSNCYRLLDTFFNRLSDRIRMRTMFKRLYFRSFRKAFAPLGNGRKRDLSFFEESSFYVNSK